EEFFRIAKEINFDISVMERIFKILSNNLKQVSDLDPFLNHNDFGPKHIMVNKNQITGILDWGEVSGHSPINDFAKWDYWFGEELPIELLKQGYLDKKLFNEDFEWMLNWIKLNNGLGVLWWYYQQKYKKAVEKAKNKLIKELKYYK
ncbi:MAG: phosphotransferase, partial [Patescibacteria group bacterium]|nr:phosphotransferase [Patescibacteria group bacterium]